MEQEEITDEFYEPKVRRRCTATTKPPSSLNYSELYTISLKVPKKLRLPVGNVMQIRPKPKREKCRKPHTGCTTHTNPEPVQEKTCLQFPIQKIGSFLVLVPSLYLVCRSLSLSEVIDSFFMWQTYCIIVLLSIWLYVVTVLYSRYSHFTLAITYLMTVVCFDLFLAVLELK
eukprot:TRINITY_DN9958_c0_g1_i1.p1 TRINITY_DN9958_c0_g1~~TRINITY_DN9958_c0_g1_i1.p1  ORF type:complete len:197 (+),score=28.16 TRINITY_DN9958_c0_g1_i1:76-591(+)